MDLIWENKKLSELTVVEKKKFFNKAKLIKYLYLCGPLSNTEITRKTELSLPTVLGLLNELMADGFVAESGLGDSSGGRRPNLYGIKDDSMFVLGIDIGRYSTRMAIFNNNNKMVTELVDISIKLENTRAVLDTICEKAQQLISDSGIDRKRFAGVGIDVPGLINSSTGNNHTYFNTLGKPLQKYLEEKFDCPVFLENDAKARAYAEFRFGLAKGKQNVLVLYLGWGVGLGMILNGQLYRGHTGFAGEFSHIPMVENGLFCQCGKRGCLETLISATTLANLAKEGIKNNSGSILSSLANEDIDKIETRMIAEAANMGDQYAISILTKLGLDLGKGLAILIQLMNPEMIIIQGRLTVAKHYIVPPIQQSINSYCTPEIRDSTSIVMSDLGQFPALMGIVALLFENLLDEASLQDFFT